MIVLFSIIIYTTLEPSHESLKKLAEGLCHSLSNICTFSMRNCHIGDEGMKIMTPHLAACKFPILILDNCGLTDDSGDYIASIIKGQECQLDGYYWNTSLRMYDYKHKDTDNHTDNNDTQLHMKNVYKSSIHGYVTSSDREKLLAVVEGAHDRAVVGSTNSATISDQCNGDNVLHTTTTTATATATATDTATDTDPNCLDDIKFQEKYLLKGLRGISLRGNHLETTTVHALGKCLAKNDWIIAVDLRYVLFDNYNYYCIWRHV